MVIIAGILFLLVLIYAVIAVNKAIDLYFGVQRTIWDAHVALTLAVINRGRENVQTKTHPPEEPDRAV